MSKLELQLGNKQVRFRLRLGNTYVYVLSTYKRIRGERMHPPYMGLFQTLLLEIYCKSRRLFLGMHVIGSLATRGVFVVAPSVLNTSESTESVNFVDEILNRKVLNGKS